MKTTIAAILALSVAVPLRAGDTGLKQDLNISVSCNTCTKSSTSPKHTRVFLVGGLSKFFWRLQADDFNEALNSLQSYVDARVGRVDRAGFDEFVAGMRTWPRQADVFRSVHPVVKTYIVDEQGHILGIMDEVRRFGDPLPGLVFLGNSPGRTIFVGLSVGHAAFTYKGQAYEVVASAQ